MHNHQVANTSNSDAQQLLTAYFQALNEGVNHQDFSQATGVLAKIRAYQTINGGDLVPSETKLESELFLNKLDVFNRLRNFYGILSLVLTFTFLFVTVKS
jgi:hypothetical protein